MWVKHNYDGKFHFLRNAISKQTPCGLQKNHNQVCLSPEKLRAMPRSCICFCCLKAEKSIKEFQIKRENEYQSGCSKKERKEHGRLIAQPIKKVDTLAKKIAEQNRLNINERQEREAKAKLKTKQSKKAHKSPASSTKSEKVNQQRLEQERDAWYSAVEKSKEAGYVCAGHLITIADKVSLECQEKYYLIEADPLHTSDCLSFSKYRPTCITVAQCLTTASDFVKAVLHKHIGDTVEIEMKEWVILGIETLPKDCYTQM